MKIKIQTEKVISVSDWDALVEQTYGRPYSFQQQDGCKNRGREYLGVPARADDFERNSVPEVVNGPEQGVSFAAWLKRDPKAPLASNRCEDWGIRLWWDRNFYPDIQMVANDLCAKGLLEPGDYTIDIDW